MTSSLPDYSSSSVKPSAADAASLAALAPAAGNDAGSASGTSPGFAALMDASSVKPPAADAGSLAALAPAASNDTCSASGASPGFAALMAASSGPAAVPVPRLASEPPAGIITFTSVPTRMISVPPPAPTATAPGSPVEPALSLLGLKAALGVTSVEASAPVAPAATPSAPASRREITRDMLEEAVSFVTSLLQAALPEVQVPQLTAVTGSAEPGPGATVGSPDDGTLAWSPTLSADATPGPLAPNEPPVAPAFTLAADGAMELKLDLAQLRPAGIKLNLPFDQPVAINAELKMDLIQPISAGIKLNLPSAQPVASTAEPQRPDEIIVRFEAKGSVAAPDAPAPVGVSGRAIFAAKYPGGKISVESSGQPGERNFVFTGDKQVKVPSPVAGISVAKTETTMPVAPIEEPRFTRNPETFSVLPQRAEFQVVVPPAERITVPADAPAGQNFAERAVDTVTSLVDTQFSASMQKSGSVQLRLRFGGEDLSVRVEIRDGVVHTDFHTDSPELRSALAQEWQTVAAQSPEQMRRYLEPVFSPAPASADTPVSFTRLQQQSQQDLPSRTPRELWVEPASSFSRRSQLSDSFIPEPAVTRGPSFLPTSMRLSVLA